MPPITAGPICMMVLALTEAPSSITATSNSVLALKSMPGNQRVRRRPNGADRGADQDGEHQRFQPGAAEQVNFDDLQHAGRGGDREGQQQARQHGADGGAGALERLAVLFLRLFRRGRRRNGMLQGSLAREQVQVEC